MVASLVEMWDGTYMGRAILSLVIASVAVNLGGRTVLKAARRKGLSALEAINFRMCPSCQYKLDGLLQVGECPECGHPFSPSSLEGQWREAYRHEV
jgi:hypothetical protein